MSEPNDTVTFEKVTVKQETPRAILVAIGSGQVWVPKSVIHDDSEVYAMDTDGDLIVARWFAEKEGIS